MSQERELFEWVKANEEFPKTSYWRFVDSFPIDSKDYHNHDDECIYFKSRHSIPRKYIEWLKPITKPMIKEEDLNDLIAMLSFGGFLSDRITVKEAAIKIKRFIENMNFSLKPESITNSEGWISADIEPEQGKIVLCLTNTGRMEVGYFHDAEWESDTSQSFEYRGYTITHWQPLPPTPNEKSTSLKPKKLTDSEIERMAEEIRQLKEIRNTYNQLNSRLSEELRTANGKIYELEMALKNK